MLNIHKAPVTADATSEPYQSLALQALGFSDSQIDDLGHMFRYAKGRILLVSGQSGSGKSTTVKHLAEYLLECQPSLNIFSVEYNPEYSIRGVAQIPVKNIADYAQVIASVVRLDPDVVIVGEIRDAATALAVLRLAETGHTVITSIRASVYKLEDRYSSFDGAVERFSLLTGKMEVYVITLMLGWVQQELSLENDKFRLTVDICHYASRKHESANMQRVIYLLESLTTSEELSAKDLALMQNIMTSNDRKTTALRENIVAEAEPSSFVDDKLFDRRVIRLQRLGFSEDGALLIVRGFDSIYAKCIKDIKDILEILEQLATSNALSADDTDTLNRCLSAETIIYPEQDMKENCRHIDPAHLMRLPYGFSEHGSQAIADVLQRFAES